MLPEARQQRGRAIWCEDQTMEGRTGMQPDRSCWTYAENWDSSKFDDTFEWDERTFSLHQK